MTRRRVFVVVVAVLAARIAVVLFRHAGHDSDVAHDDHASSTARE